MFDDFEKTAAHIIAAIFGWIFISIPKVLDKKMSWVAMLSSIGLAGVVGFIAGSVLAYMFPQWPSNVVCSITSILGASCQHWMNRFLRFTDRAADQIEDAALSDKKSDKL